MSTFAFPSQVPDCEHLRKAFGGWGTNVGLIISILANRNAAQCKLIRQIYAEIYGVDLLIPLVKELSSDFELLLSLVGSSRYSGDEVDMTRAKSDAKILHEKISKKAYSDDDFILILAIRSKAQINAILNEYKNEFGNEINKDLKADLKGCRFISHRCQFKFKKRKDLSEFLALLRTAVKCLTYPEKYFEKVLRLAINKEGGTDGGVLTRVVTTRAKVDMKTIKDAYQKRNSVPLDRAIVKNTITIGDYEKMLLTLIRNGDA